MKVELSKYECKVIREEGDPKIYNESLLLYKVKQALIKQGYDVIKKRMWRDGHLVDERQQYIRSRDLKHQDSPDFMMIHYGMWNSYFIYEDYNEKGEVDLDVVRGGD